MLDNLKKAFGKGWQAPAIQPLPDGMSVKVAGIEYHSNEMAAISTIMKKWDMTDEQIRKKYPGKKIYHYYFTTDPVELIPEPTNQHDPNAIKVVIAGQHVGYIPKTDTELVQAFLVIPHLITAQISGGDYKIINEDGSKVQFSEPLSVTVRIKKG